MGSPYLSQGVFQLSEEILILSFSSSKTLFQPHSSNDKISDQGVGYQSGDLNSEDPNICLKSILLIGTVHISKSQSFEFSFTITFHMVHIQKSSYARNVLIRRLNKKCMKYWL